MTPNLLLLVASALLALLGGLFALLLLQRGWTGAVRADANTLTQLTLGHKAGGLTLGPLEAPAQNIMQLVKRSGQTVGANSPREDTPKPVAAKPTPPVDNELSNPIFQSSEVLDIDILDEDDPFAMQDGDGQTSSARPSRPCPPRSSAPTISVAWSAKA
ncbi:hypothetical protein ULG90_18340 [Halopseudomonas pachastrellae]|nr:hypothetical protein ULG90_18340 [Halopseudomonas pachastrellae]